MGQLYYKNLYDEFFNRYPKDATEFFAVSGYLGPDPLMQLNTLPFNSRIIFGLQKENKNLALHQQLLSLNSKKVNILYPEICSHAKCYVWLKDGKPIRGLIGSANFSINGLSNDYRETLLEVESRDLHPLLAYINTLADSAFDCSNADINNFKALPVAQAASADCVLELFDPSTNEVQDMSGLNWGFSNGKVGVGDAYIAIRKKHLKAHPNLFQPKFYNPKDGHRSRSKSKEVAEIIWDDGVVMKVLFEGSQELNGNTYPKQISSIPRKNILGDYIRDRIDKPKMTAKRNPKDKITRQDLLKYGRDKITLSLIQPGLYKADFSI